MFPAVISLQLKGHNDQKIRENSESKNSGKSRLTLTFKEEIKITGIKCGSYLLLNQCFSNFFL